VAAAIPLVLLAIFVPRRLLAGAPGGPAAGNHPHGTAPRG
jgi:hypothetical protein